MPCLATRAPAPAATNGVKPEPVVKHRGGHERRRGGDVEGALAIAAGADNVEQMLILQTHIHASSLGAHGPREAEQLLGGLAFHAKGHQERADLGGGRFSGQDGGHGLLSLGRGQVGAVCHSMQEGK